MQQYTITLADGQKLTDLTVNGDNYVSQTEVDESIFDNNLSTMTVSDGETETVYHNMQFIQQMKWADGTYYLAFRELSEQEIEYASLSSKIDYIAMMADIDFE